ncbi:hypothetical protein EVAR_89815_1 [Eumeta japonica]|uniref:Uncharacterized protein n=1 Tax=Eumeta variegata TaxID=151549 RepID=A0A4C1YIL6_EUMVA|nr:hypothetical protein EVAR_89815_1 [Eumeta japonica]
MSIPRWTLSSDSRNQAATGPELVWVTVLEYRHEVGFLLFSLLDNNINILAYAAPELLRHKGPRCAYRLYSYVSRGEISPRGEHYHQGRQGVNASPVSRKLYCIVENAVVEWRAVEGEREYASRQPWARAASEDDAR